MKKRKGAQFFIKPVIVEERLQYLIFCYFKGIVCRVSSPKDYKRACSLLKMFQEGNYVSWDDISCINGMTIPVDFGPRWAKDYNMVGTIWEWKR